VARDLAVADCETDPFKIGRVPQPFVWGYYDGTDYRQFDSTAKFVEFVNEQGTIIYAHNGGKFDWHFVLPYLNPYDDIMIINGRIARCNLGMSELRDSYNILPVPLAAYKKDKIDYAIMEPDQRNKPHNKRKIAEYLKSDCMYLYELISGFVNLYGVQITQASAAMNQWKKISQRKLPQTDKGFYDLLAPYYYGGRVECFESGIIDTKFNVLDINSAYPYAMMHKHPYSGDFTHVEAYVENADFYKIRCISRGAFPYRGEGNPGEFAGLRFPNDSETRVFTVTGHEFQAAKRTGTMEREKVLESFVFTEHVDFGEYITHFYEMRKAAKAKGNEAESLFAKLLMNSLYGKFAANPENYRNYMIVPMDVIAGLGAMGWTFGGELGPWGLAEAPLLEKQMRYYNVATGASITGFVRAMLWEAIANSTGVLYCDTDSIAVRVPGSIVRFGEEIGEWKHEGNFDRAGIAGKKLYIFRGIPDKRGRRDYKAASKGARLTHSQLWEVAAGGMVVFQNPVPTFSVSKAPVFTDRRIKYTAKTAKGKLDVTPVEIRVNRGETLKG
jgi:DNA polymerase elongation subunit (family B)